MLRQKKADLREYKKKKALKKSDRMKVVIPFLALLLSISPPYLLQEISEHRETEKQRWKSFTTKVTSHLMTWDLFICLASTYSSSSTSYSSSSSSSYSPPKHVVGLSVAS